MHPSILKEIGHIDFADLQYLKISGNGLESIEGINRIWMPVLKELWMHHELSDKQKKNFITSIDSLRKANLPLLEVLSISSPFFT